MANSNNGYLSKLQYFNNLNLAAIKGDDFPILYYMIPSGGEQWGRDEIYPDGIHFDTPRCVPSDQHRAHVVLRSPMGSATHGHPTVMALYDFQLVVTGYNWL